jgi:hypothetical protein
MGLSWSEFTCPKMMAKQMRRLCILPHGNQNSVRGDYASIPRSISGSSELAGPKEWPRIVR